MARARPNFVFVLTDDQGYGDLGCHGNKILQTPHLDRLHEQSVRLTSFHVDPTCSPTRAALMTGRYSTRVGVWHTVMGRHMPRRNEVMMPRVFADSGLPHGAFSASGTWATASRSAPTSAASSTPSTTTGAASATSAIPGATTTSTTPTT